MKNLKKWKRLFLLVLMVKSFSIIAADRIRLTEVHLVTVGDKPFKIGISGKTAGQNKVKVVFTNVSISFLKNCQKQALLQMVSSNNLALEFFIPTNVTINPSLDKRGYKIITSTLRGSGNAACAAATQNISQYNYKNNKGFQYIVN